jgi:hypothetical protein
MGGAMNVAEGARRMQFAGRWMVSIALVGSILFVVLTLAFAYLPASQSVHGIALLEFIPLFVPIAGTGAILWLAGWIVEGFAKKDS